MGSVKFVEFSRGPASRWPPRSPTATPWLRVVVLLQDRIDGDRQVPGIAEGRPDVGVRRAAQGHFRLEVVAAVGRLQQVGGVPVIVVVEQVDVAEIVEQAGCESVVRRSQSRGSRQDPADHGRSHRVAHEPGGGEQLAWGSRGGPARGYQGGQDDLAEHRVAQQDDGTTQADHGAR